MLITELMSNTFLETQFEDVLLSHVNVIDPTLSSFIILVDFNKAIKCGGFSQNACAYNMDYGNHLRVSIQTPDTYDRRELEIDLVYRLRAIFSHWV